jgi:predicted CoA-substrate-specific enzyme activase
MVTVGVDMGMENVKVVVLKDGEIVGRAKRRSGGIRRLESAEEAVQEAMKAAGLSADARADKTIATGKGKFDLAAIVDDILTEPVTAAKAAEFLCPGATCVVNVGADETMAMTLDGDYGITQMMINEKCAAGPGHLIRNMGRRLGLSPDEMAALPPVADGGPRVSDGCIVFAELDALSLLNDGVSAQEVGSAITATAVIRASTILSDITIPNLENTVLLGGLTNNPAFTEALKAQTGIDFVIPADAEYAPALGAALYAADWGVSHFADNSLVQSIS